MRCLSVYFCAVVSAFFIKGFFYDHGRKFPSPYVNFQLRADLGMGGRQVGQGNTLHQRRREHAAGKFSDGFSAGDVNGIMGAGRGSLAGVFNSRQPLAETVGFLFPEDIGTDEIRIQRAEEAEPGFQRRLDRKSVV